MPEAARPQEAMLTNFPPVQGRTRMAQRLQAAAAGCRRANHLVRHLRRETLLMSREQVLRVAAADCRRASHLGYHPMRRERRLMSWE